MLDICKIQVMDLLDQSIQDTESYLEHNSYDYLNEYEDEVTAEDTDTNNYEQVLNNSDDLQSTSSYG